MVELGLQNILQAKTRKDFEKAFDNFIADDASITMNGKPVALFHYREHLWNEQMLEKSANVQFKEVVEVVEDPKALLQVSIFSLASLFLGIDVGVADWRGGSVL